MKTLVVDKDETENRPNTVFLKKFFDHQVHRGAFKHVVIASAGALKDKVQSEVAALPSDEVLILAHLTEDDWNHLLEVLPARAYLVRFSSGKIEAIAPRSGKLSAMAFACCKKKDDLSAADIDALMQVFCEPSKLASLCSGNVPPELGHLFRFAPPKVLQSIDILLQFWVANPQACTLNDFRKALGLTNEANSQLLWTEIGKEMGFVVEPKKHIENTMSELIDLVDKDLKTLEVIIAKDANSWTSGKVARARDQLRAFLAASDW